MTWLRERTLCRIGRHCAPRRREQKFNGGRGAQVCCYCYRIAAYGFREAADDLPAPG